MIPMEEVVEYQNEERADASTDVPMEVLQESQNKYNEQSPKKEALME